MFADSLAAYQRLGDEAGETNVMFNLATVAQEQGEIAEAASCLEAVLRRLRVTGPPSDVGMALNNLGNVRGRQGQPEAARALYEEALRLQRELGSGPSVARALHNLARIATDSGNLAAAQTYLAESLALSAELGAKDIASHALAGCVDLERAPEGSGPRQPGCPEP